MDGAHSEHMHNTAMARDKYSGSTVNTRFQIGCCFFFGFPLASAAHPMRSHLFAVQFPPRVHFMAASRRLPCYTFVFCTFFSTRPIVSSIITLLLHLMHININQFARNTMHCWVCASESVCIQISMETTRWCSRTQRRVRKY